MPTNAAATGDGRTPSGCARLRAHQTREIQKPSDFSKKPMPADAAATETVALHWAAPVLGRSRRARSKGAPIFRKSPCLRTFAATETVALPRTPTWLLT